MSVKRKSLHDEIGEGYYTPEEVGEFLQVSASKVRALIRSGALRATLPNGTRRFRIRLEDFKAYLDASRYEPTDVPAEPTLYETTPEMARLAQGVLLSVHQKKTG